MNGALRDAGTCLSAFVLVRGLAVACHVQVQAGGGGDVLTGETALRAFALTLGKLAPLLHEEINDVLRARLTIGHAVLPEDGRGLHEQAARFRALNGFAELVGAL